MSVESLRSLLLECGMASFKELAKYVCLSLFILFRSSTVNIFRKLLVTEVKHRLGWGGGGSGRITSTRVRVGHVASDH